jgi:HPt (histidine-containing phosphotransfer) domain-containing protein
MTAHVLSGVADKCLAAGMNDSIAKPINLNLLNQKLRKLLPSSKFAEITEGRSALADDPNELEHCDLSNLFEMTNNKPEKVAKYVGMVQKNLPVDLEILKGRKEAEDWVELKKVAHKIKGSIGYIGAVKISEEIKYLEGLDLENIEIEKINTLTLLVEEEIMLILSELSKLKIIK